MTETWTRVAGLDEINEGEPFPVEIMGLNLALYKVGAEIFCTDNVCTHAFALLSDGWLDEHVIECPLHAGQFDIRTGKGLGPPINQDLRTFPVKLDGADVLVVLTGG